MRWDVQNIFTPKLARLVMLLKAWFERTEVIAIFETEVWKEDMASDA